MQIQHPTGYFFGTAPDGHTAHVFEIAGKSGLKMRVSSYGAAILSLEVPLSGDETLDVVLGFDSLEDYVESINLPAPPYFGAAIGRWAGRIHKGIFSLNGRSYRLDVNNNGHTLHGGKKGFSQLVWDLKYIDDHSITFAHQSPDGAEGFPGNVRSEVTYTLTSDNELIVEFDASSSVHTIVNLTQHSYFNLEGHTGDVTNQILQVASDKLLETLDMIPTGKFLEAASTHFDYRNPAPVPRSIDATFVLSAQASPAAILYSPATNLQLEVFTNQPAVHIYVGGDCFGKIKGKDQVEYHPHSGICFETQNFPDAPNHKHFPDPVLYPGRPYRHKTIYKFSNR
jgi:aldose 1-epimerase